MGAKSASGLRRLAGRIALATAAALLLLVAPALAAPAASTFTVSGFADGPGTCTTPGASGASVCPTLRAAVNQANTQSNSPTIQLSPATYQLTAGNGGQLDLAMSMNITGAGPGGSGGTTIEQTDGHNRVLEVDGTTKLSGLEITGGHYSPPWTSGGITYGGGILVLGTLALQNALVTGNQALGAAGPTSPDAGNSAQGGGVDYGSTALAGSVISNSTITGNSAVGGAGASGGNPGGKGEGGGIAYNGNGPVVIQNSTISGNAAAGGAGGGGASSGGKGGDGEGGGIFNASDLTLTGTTVAGNTATGGAEGTGPSPAPSSSGGPGDGGGIFSQESVDQLVNSTVFGNLAHGGTGVTGGSPGSAYGGGILAEGSDGGAVLQSDTIDANQTSFRDSNLDIAVGNPPNPYTFTIHDTIVAGGLPAAATSCELSSSSTPPSSESYNLEDDAAGQCGFKAANHDLVGVNPQLQSGLSDNGGPTQTLAPSTTSPVLSAGGQCLDPTSSPPNQPRGVDQRGQPRLNPCDIGAVQTQPPKNTTPPAVSGRPLAGQTLSCGPGTWSGDGPLSFAYQWLRDGAGIAGATSSPYAIGVGDVGHAIACAVTATHYGSASATSGSISVIPTAVISLLKATVSGGLIVVKLGCRGAPGEVCGGLLKATTIETMKAGRLVAVSARVRQRLRGLTHVIALRAYTIVAGRTSTVPIELDGPGARLLKRFGRLPVRLTLTQFTASGTKTVASRRVTVRPNRPKRRKHHR